MSHTPITSRAVPHPLSSQTGREEPRTGYRSLGDPDSLREFAKNLGEGIYITAPDGEILDANPAFLETVGVESLQDLKGLRAYDFFVEPKQRELELRLLERDGRVR